MPTADPKTLVPPKLVWYPRLLSPESCTSSVPKLASLCILMPSRAHPHGSAWPGDLACQFLLSCLPELTHGGYPISSITSTFSHCYGHPRRFLLQSSAGGLLISSVGSQGLSRNHTTSVQCGSRQFTDLCQRRSPTSWCSCLPVSITSVLLIILLIFHPWWCWVLCHCVNWEHQDFSLIFQPLFLPLPHDDTHPASFWEDMTSQLHSRLHFLVSWP